MRVFVMLKFYQNLLLACNYVSRNAVFYQQKVINVVRICKR